eukprot:11976458-Alexandrium_andersonii.AAC.1
MSASFYWLPTPRFASLPSLCAGRASSRGLAGHRVRLLSFVFSGPFLKVECSRGGRKFRTG